MSICEEKDVFLYQNQISITMEPSIYRFHFVPHCRWCYSSAFIFVCKDSWKENFQELSPLPTDYGYSYAAAFGKLFGTFLLWYSIKNADSSILMNMSTYFLCYSLFSSALIMLLDRFYITKRRVWTHIILWIIFSTLSGVVVFLVPSGIIQKSLYLL